ncbi:metallophosphoesterase [Azonexus sp.]|jgi:predicted MPP superfamily phosphohydrolase|uniref:metallophosphoesterase n=1 Tax=Azonexus sp. TaxID=1872668 RepID=UPI0028333786|nr:metallophosphoesterase [Azonexus sp.]MDR1995446.1 metallophosphoesterase [Azonexus sp.]
MKRLRWIVRLTVLCLAVWSIGFEPSWLQQRELTLTAPGWSGPPLTIAVAADLHVGAPHAGLPMLRRVVDQLNASHPDLILLPGDFVIQEVLGGEMVAPAAIAGELARLKAPLGVYALLGNHDWWYDGEQIRQDLQNVGITILDNNAVALPTAVGPLWLVGIGDDMTGHARPAQAFAQVPAAAPLIVMMHDPANAPELPARTLVAFAGHTHGGQVRLPFIGALITPGRSPLRHAYGWIPDVPAPTFVTAGVGTSILPIRFNCPPETVVLRLSGQTSS